MIVAEYKGRTIRYMEHQDDWGVTIQGFEERFSTLLKAKEYIEYLEARMDGTNILSAITQFRDERKKNLKYWM
jgi:predicted transcriptional regulator